MRVSPNHWAPRSSRNLSSASQCHGSPTLRVISGWVRNYQRETSIDGVVPVTPKTLFVALIGADPHKPSNPVAGKLVMNC
jgi:hypothetical protein